MANRLEAMRTAAGPLARAMARSAMFMLPPRPPPLVKRKVTFLPGAASAEVEGKATIYDAAVDAGASVNGSCGGRGVCGRCKVLVDGPTERDGDGPLTPDEVASGYRMACLARPLGDVSVMVPETAMNGGMRIESGYADRELGELLPLAYRRTADMPAPTLEDPAPDLERLLAALGQGRLDIPLGVLKTLPSTARSSGWKVSALIADTGSGSRIMSVEPASRPRRDLGLAIDLGTTTVAAEMVDLRNGKVVARASDYNRQIICGEDVLSRIAYAEEHGPRRLNELVLDTINSLLPGLCAQRDDERKFHSGRCGEDVVAVAVAGNTAMVHLLLGLDPTNIRYEPYVPAAGSPPALTASEVGLNVSGEAIVACVPGVASYVGGDITADVVLSGMMLRDEPSLLIDVGTNGEVVLGCRDWAVCCSTSAGPAFEGGEVSCGMRAMSGAIDAVSISGGKVDVSVMGGGRPLGICGSGLIDLIGQAFLDGEVDRKGRLTESPLRKETDRGPALMVSPPEDGSKAITVTEDDIANAMRTKAAIYAGCSALLRSVGMTFDDVSQVLVAGGFGRHIGISNAQAMGLLPDLPEERFSVIGNASLGGARAFLMSAERRAEARAARDGMTYMDLSSSSEFFDQYSSALFLPHTDAALFPRVLGRMKGEREGG